MFNTMTTFDIPTLDETNQALRIKTETRKCSFSPLFTLQLTIHYRRPPFCFSVFSDLSVYILESQILPNMSNSSEVDTSSGSNSELSEAWSDFDVEKSATDDKFVSVT